MKLSILIPCFNASAHLEPTLKSVLSNMEMDDDIIVVDDHSQDDSTARAKHILSQANVHHTVTTTRGKEHVQQGTMPFRWPKVN